MVSDIDDTIPLGASISIDFRFNGEGITLPPTSSTDLTFYSLFHVPAIEPTSIFYDIELRRTIVSYNHVSPSLSGEYVLCQEAGPPPSRRRRGVAPEPMRSSICGGRITITVTSKYNAELSPKYMSVPVFTGMQYYVSTDLRNIIDRSIVPGTMYMTLPFAWFTYP